MRMVLLRTKAGGQVQIALPPEQNFQALMKAVRADGMLLSETFMCPFDSIDSCLVAEVADKDAPQNGNVHHLVKP